MQVAATAEPCDGLDYFGMIAWLSLHAAISPEQRVAYNACLLQCLQRIPRHAGGQAG